MRFVLALPAGDFRRGLGVRGEVALDGRALGLAQLPIGIGVQRIGIDREGFARHFTVLSLGSSPMPVNVRRAARARPRRDIRVPIGMPITSAASA